jgi:hypothetical protein
MRRWSYMWRWHFRYKAEIELTHNPTGDTRDAKRLQGEIERGIRKIQLTEGYRIAGVNVKFMPEDDDVHLAEEGKRA